MRIVELRAEGFKRLRAIDITPTGDVITIGGRNGAGKSSVLDAIWAAMKGRSVAPPKPVRQGVEKATIRLDLGDLVVTRTFIDKGDGKPFTDSVKVENAEGMRYSSPQDVLNGLLGEIGFDPFEFMNLKPAEQAERLLELVPLSIDLDEHAELDASDYAKRTDTNRDISNLEARLSAIQREELPEEIPDRNALVEKLGSASGHNLELEREQIRRDNLRASNDGNRRRQSTLIDQIAAMKAELTELEGLIARVDGELEGLPEIGAPIDVAELQEQIRQAENLAGIVARHETRAALEAELTEKRAESVAFTAAMVAREKAREEALTEAEMPVEGLGFQINEKGKPVVTYLGLPFDKDQISTAAALRVSTAIAMAANPTLRVLQIRDGSLLDDDAMAALAEMASEQEFQVWIERVGTAGVGIVLEDGAIVEQGGEQP